MSHENFEESTKYRLQLVSIKAHRVLPGKHELRAFEIEHERMKLEMENSFWYDYHFFTRFMAVWEPTVSFHQKGAIVIKHIDNFDKVFRRKIGESYTGIPMGEFEIIRMYVGVPIDPKVIKEMEKAAAALSRPWGYAQTLLVENFVKSIDAILSVSK